MLRVTLAADTKTGYGSAQESMTMQAPPTSSGRPDANRIALCAARAVLDAAAPIKLTVEGTPVDVQVERLPAAIWPSAGLIGLDEKSDGPLPSAVRARCSWPGGSTTLLLSIDWWRGGSYHHFIGLRTAVESTKQEIGWITVPLPIRGGADGTSVSILTSFSPFKRQDDTASIRKARLKAIVDRSGLPLDSPWWVEAFDVALPGGEVSPSPAAGFERMIHLALLKLPFFVRGAQRGIEGKPLFDLGFEEADGEDEGERGPQSPDAEGDREVEAARAGAMTEPLDGELGSDDSADLPVEEEDSNAEFVTQPFDPTKIRIETKTMTVDLLIRRIQAKEIDLSPDFQRMAGLWKAGAQSRLIESLLIRIPVPAFYMDATDDDRWLVVDGLQRLTVLRRFVVDKELTLTELEFLRELTGKRFNDLPRALQRRIEETQVTVNLIQPGTPSEVKFNIFKRINTGGLPLSPQEIRHALNQGVAAVMLQDLAALPEFGRVAGKSIKNQRMTDRECVLRFLAFVLTPPSAYTSPNLDGFLNDQMKRLNGMSDDERGRLCARFSRAMVAAHDVFGPDAFRKRYQQEDPRKPINKALFECWSVALDALSDEEVKVLTERRAALRVAFVRLMNVREFDAAISQGTGDIRKVQLRFSAVERLIREIIS